MMSGKDSNQQPEQADSSINLRLKSSRQLGLVGPLSGPGWDSTAITLR
jgi:hypothetical protein